MPTQEEKERQRKLREELRATALEQVEKEKRERLSRAEDSNSLAASIRQHIKHMGVVEQVVVDEYGKDISRIETQLVRVGTACILKGAYGLMDYVETPSGDVGAPFIAACKALVDIGNAINKYHTASVNAGGAEDNVNRIQIVADGHTLEELAEADEGDPEEREAYMEHLQNKADALVAANEETEELNADREEVERQELED